MFGSSFIITQGYGGGGIIVTKGFGGTVKEAAGNICLIANFCFDETAGFASEHFEEMALSFSHCSEMTMNLCFPDPCLRKCDD